MSTRTMHTLVPPVRDEDTARREVCAAWDHPAHTHNPWAGETFCLCGAARYPGAQQPGPDRRGASTDAMWQAIRARASGATLGGAVTTSDSAAPFNVEAAS